MILEQQSLWSFFFYIVSLICYSFRLLAVVHICIILSSHVDALFHSRTRPFAEVRTGFGLIPPFSANLLLEFDFHAIYIIDHSRLTVNYTEEMKAFEGKLATATEPSSRQMLGAIALVTNRNGIDLCPKQHSL